MVAAGASAARLRRHHLTTSSPDPAVDEAIERAKLTIGSRSEPDEPQATLGLLACGRFEDAAERIGAGTGPADLLARHYFGWTGELSALGERRAAVRRDYEEHGLDPDSALDLRGRALEPDGPDTVLLTTLVYGLLGAVPDAPVGRLELRPRIPAGWDRFGLEHLKMGASDIALRYRREGERHTFRLRQQRGAMPVQLVFAPALPAAGLATARVDGERAELDARTIGERLVAPLQIVLDHERTVEFDARTDESAPDAA